MLKTALGRVRLIGLIEGVSFLVLLFIAMPLKYFADFPEAVTFCGWIHGILFMFYLSAIADATITDKWSFIRVAAALFAAVIPFGPFILDVRLRKEHQVMQKQKYQSS